MFAKGEKSTGVSAYALICCLSMIGFMMSACRPPDQTIVKDEHREIADPTPSTRNFEAINKQHKVLMAVFDSGVDYNHPDLLQNTHFELDKKGKPVGYGYDYLGQDNWGSYRIVDTSLYEYKDQSKDKKKEIDAESDPAVHNKEVRSIIDRKQCKIDAVNSAEPELKKYLNVYRHTMLESYGENIHGTHVAGLMTYDRPDFGVISYRVLPYHRTSAQDRDERLLKTDIFVNNIADALEKVAKVRDSNGRGIRIVNLSLGGSLTRPNAQETENDLERNAQVDRAIKLVYEGMTKVIAKYPDILFVAAAGNDGGWSDNKTRVQYPCGVEAPNVLCVGATNNFENLSSFTNIPLNDIDLVFAPGYDIKSTFPSDQCRALNNFMDNMMEDTCTFDPKAKKWGAKAEQLALLKPMLQGLKQSCDFKESRYIKMSGTSMATPIVSRVAGEILAANPNLNPTQVIEAIRKKSEVRTGRQFTAFVLKQKRLATPSWSKATEATNTNNGGSSVKVPGPAWSMVDALEMGIRPKGMNSIQAVDWEKGVQEYRRYRLNGFSFASGKPE
jgi:subtilisin family serine protease